MTPRLKLLRFRPTAKYLAFACGYDYDEENPSDAEFHLHGGYRPTLFKTLRNARAAAGRHGVIALLDPSLLPVVDADDIYERDDRDELQFAERQAVLWAERAESLQRQMRLVADPGEEAEL